MKTLEPEELLAGTPLEKDVAFSAPWEARAFAIAVRLSKSGLCTWDEFRRHLITEIGRGDKVRAHGWVEDSDGYYVYFLRALEDLLREKRYCRYVGAGDKDARHQRGRSRRS